MLLCRQNKLDDFQSDEPGNLGLVQKLRGIQIYSLLHRCTRYHHKPSKFTFKSTPLNMTALFICLADHFVSEAIKAKLCLSPAPVERQMIN